MSGGQEFVVELAYAFEAADDAARARLAELIADGWRAVTPWEDFIVGTELREVNFFVGSLLARDAHEAQQQLTEIVQRVLGAFTVPEGITWVDRLRVEAMPADVYLSMTADDDASGGEA